MSQGRVHAITVIAVGDCTLRVETSGMILCGARCCQH